MNNKLKSCSFVKTVLMFIIVLYHSILFWGGNWFSAVEAEFVAPLHYLSQWFGTFHIYGFVLVSGYIFGFLKVEQGKYSSFPKFAINKFFRLIVPYAFISVCWVIPIGWFFFKYDFTTVLENYILAINPSQLWFLVMLFVVFLIVWPLTNFFENHNLLSFLLAVTLYLLAIIASSFIPNVFQVLSAFKYVVFFLIGLKLRQLDRKKKLSPTPLLTLILLVFK